MTLAMDATNRSVEVSGNSRPRPRQAAWGLPVRRAALVVLLALAAAAGRQWWSVPRVDPALVGQWVEEFVQVDGTRLDVELRADGSCEFGRHAEELLSTYLAPMYSGTWSTPGGGQYELRQSWGVRGNEFVLVNNVAIADGRWDLQVQDFLCRLLKRKTFDSLPDDRRQTQFYEIVRRDADRLELRQTGGEGRFPTELRLIRW